MSHHKRSYQLAEATRHAWVGVLIASALWSTAFAIETAVTREPKSLPRESLRCGPNALLMFLIRCGFNPTNEFIESIDCGASGVSLAELNALARSCGITTEVRRFDAADYQSIPMPAICLTNRSFIGIKHFELAYAVDSGGIDVIDGTTGQRHRVRAEKIDSYLSGYWLVPSRGPLAMQLAHQEWLFAILLIVTLVVIWMNMPSRPQTGVLSPADNASRG